MSNTVPRMVLYCTAQVIAATCFWFFTVLERDWEATQQFIGHLGPSMFLVGLGAAAIFFRDTMRALAAREAWLAMIAGGLYVLADTFIMHPPLGVLSGPGQAEQEHVAIMGLVFVLGLSGLVVLRKTTTTTLPVSAHFLIGIAVAALVFMGHPQHTVAGQVGHNATVLFLGVAALFRVLDKTVEYAMAMIVAAFVFFCSQVGFATYVETVRISPGAWVAFWSMLGFASATGFLALSPRAPVAAE